VSLHDLIDPESRGPLAAHVAERAGFAARPLPERRALAAALDARAVPPPPAGVAIGGVTVPGPDGGGLPLRLYRPTARTGRAPVVLYVHGGGMIMGSAASDDAVAGRLCAELGAVVVSVDYRLAPEHPYPAAVRDCQAALDWTQAHADGLDADPDRLAVVGGSAGGGLALATALLARDRGRPAARLVLAMYPMIDDRGTTASSREILDLGAWDRPANQEAWGWYLGGRPADPYAAPARATDLAGLPPTFLDVGTLDLFRDEDVEFAGRLLRAGVPTELHVYPGAYHASEHLAPAADLSRRMWAARLAALRRALHPAPVPAPAGG
jgi:acetyl esterase/lipase